MSLSTFQKNALNSMSPSLFASGFMLGDTLDSILSDLTAGNLGIEAESPEVDSLALGNPTFAQDADTTSGLTFGYSAGAFLYRDALVSVVAGTIALTASQTNYVEVSPAGVVSANTAGFTAGRLPLYQIVTGSASITTVTVAKPVMTLLGDGGITGTILSTTAGTKSMPHLLGAVAATSSFLVLAPSAGTLTLAQFANATAVATSDTDYWSFALVNRGQAGAGTTNMLDSGAVNSTKATGGSALVAKGNRALGLNATGANLIVAANDVLEFTLTKTGAPAALASASLRLDFAFTG